VRDAVLRTAGLLCLDIGGPSVKPPQPAGYWSFLNFPIRDYVADHGKSRYRRGLYTYWQRTFLYPSFVAFDAPTREDGCAERPRSNTPTQALVLLNDPVYVEAARAFAERALREGGATFGEQVRWAWREALSREPSGEEVRLLEGLHSRHLEQYRADPEAARKLVSTGESPLPQDLDVGALAAWSSVARVIFNLQETLTRN
jgi:hypothetical protein